ncbi:hypothetical protein RB595_010129 [Gaeumannomyces hyphopodioides]
MDIKYSPMSVSTAAGGLPSGRVWQRAVEKVLDRLEDDDLDMAELGILDHKRGDYLLPRLSEEQLAREPGTLELVRSSAPAVRLALDLVAVMVFMSGVLSPDWFALLTVVAGWASLRALLIAAQAAAETARHVRSVVRDLSSSLLSARGYEDDHMSPRLEEILLRLHIEALSHLVCSARLLRQQPRILFHYRAWSRLQVEGDCVLRWNKRLLAAAEAEWRGARSNQTRNEITSPFVVKGIRHRSCVPITVSPRFHGREDAVKAIEKALQPSWGAPDLRSMVLYGIGGVGKTQIALRYTSLHRSSYEEILWVKAENAQSIQESFGVIAGHLELIGNNSSREGKDKSSATFKVKNWLQTTGKAWLLVFDGVDNIEMLKEAWPSQARGSILLTTRDHTGCYMDSMAQTSFCVQAFDTESGIDFLLKRVGPSPLELAADDREVARQTSVRFGGLPHALNHVAVYLEQRRLPLSFFPGMHLRNAREMDGTKPWATGSYHHSLSSLWDVTFQGLSGDALDLLNMLAYFDVDCIQENLLLRGAQHIGGMRCDFLKDEIGLADAQEVLLRAGVISIEQRSRKISMHSVIQEEVIRRQSREDREFFYAFAAHLMSAAFPERWTKDLSHQFECWDRSAKCLPHVQHLNNVRKEMAMPRGTPQLVGEILLRASWYVYETEKLSEANDMAQEACEQLRKIPPGLAYASCLDLCGLVSLDMGRPTEALEQFRLGLETREQLLGKSSNANTPLIGLSHSHIGRALTELGHLDEAHAALSESIRIRLRQPPRPVLPAHCQTKHIPPNRLGDSYSKMASLLLRMGKPDEAEAALRQSPELVDFSDDSFLRGGNPWLYGDAVLLSRIRAAQGQADAARWLASGALDCRRKTLGACLKTLDSGYDVMRMMAAHGNHATALELGCDMEQEARDLAGLEGTGQRARVLYQMHTIHKRLGNVSDARQYREMAETLRADVRPELAGAPLGDNEFDKLRPWMMW